MICVYGFNIESLKCEYFECNKTKRILNPYNNMTLFFDTSEHIRTTIKEMKERARIIKTKSPPKLVHRKMQ